MSSFNCEFIPARDQVIIKAFKEFALDLKSNPKLGFHRVNVSLGIMPPKDIDIETYFESDEYRKMTESDVDVIEQIIVYLQSDNVSIVFNRQSSKPTSKLSQGGNHQIMSLADFNNFIYKLRKELKGINSLPSSILDHEFINSIQRDLSTSTSILKEDILKTKREYEREIELDRKKMIQEIHSKREEFEAQVILKENDLKIREESIDRINNTDARRKIRQDLNKELEKRIDTFGPSKMILREYEKLNTVFQFILFSLFVTAAVMLTFIYQKLTAKSMDPKVLTYASIEVTALIFTTVSFFIYYSRWKSNWINKLVNEEFTLKRYRLDFDRSSWLIESYLEMEETYKKELPDSIIQPITTNLFENNREIIKTRHPLEDVLSFISKNTRIKVKKGENEIEFEKGKIS